jgi:hypothetical protein
MPRVKVGEHYFLKYNAHFANKKNLFCKRFKNIVVAGHSWCSSISSQEEENCAICINISFT